MPILPRNEKLSYRDDESNIDTTVVKVIAFTKAVDPASIASLASGETLITVYGVSVGDFVQANPPASLETGLVYSGCRVSAANQIALRLSNMTAGGVDGASRTWTFLWTDLTP